MIHYFYSLVISCCHKHFYGALEAKGHTSDCNFV